MSEERDRKKGFLSWVLGDEEDEEGTAIYSSDEVGMGEIEEGGEPHGFTVERAAGIIKDLPPDVSRPSAVRIVRQTLAAAGIDIEDLRRSSSRREAKLNSEIKLGQGRIRELRDKTDEYVSSLEKKIRKAREDRDAGVTREEKKISRARSSLGDVDLVRDFFELPKEEALPKRAPSRKEPSVGDETQVLEPLDANDETQVIRRRGPLADNQNPRGARGSRRDRNPRDNRER